jgi:peptide/nickel transport system permease protein
MAISIFVFFGLTFLVYLLSVLAPGSPVDQFVDSSLTSAEDVARIKAHLGLDQPIPIQYAKWVGRIFSGELGFSFRTGGPVFSLIQSTLLPTLALTFSALFLSLLIAVPLGIMSAYKPGSVWDHLATFFSYIGAAVPSFFIGMVFINIFAVRLNWTPAGGMFSSAGDHGLVDYIHHLILPMTVSALGTTGIFLRQIRGSMLEVFNEEYVRMARAKGLSEWKVVLSYVLRNSSIPVITAISMSIPHMLGGAVIVEQLFSYPGIGKLLMLSIMSRDYPVIMAISVFIAIVVLLINIVLDIVYGYLDPRIRYV